MRAAPCSEMPMTRSKFGTSPMPAELRACRILRDQRMSEFFCRAARPMPRLAHAAATENGAIGSPRARQTRSS